MSFLIPQPPCAPTNKSGAAPGGHAHTGAPARHPYGQRGHHPALRASWTLPHSQALNRSPRSSLPRVTHSTARLARSPPCSDAIRARLGHLRLPAASRTLEDDVLLGRRSGPGRRELQLEADELVQPHPRAARELEPVTEEERPRITDDLPGQEPVYLRMPGLTGGHDLEQTALVGDASDLAPVTEHGRIVVGREPPHLHDLAESGGVTTDVVELAIGSHGDPPVGGSDLIAPEAKGRGLWAGRGQASASAAHRDGRCRRRKAVREPGVAAWPPSLRVVSRSD